MKKEKEERETITTRMMKGECAERDGRKDNEE